MPVHLRFKFIATAWNNDLNIAVNELKKIAGSLCQGLGYRFTFA